MGGEWQGKGRTMMMAPCPFCGNKKNNICYCIDDGWGNCHYKPENETWSVECGICTAEGPWGKTKDEAILAWNERVNYYPPALDVEEYYNDTIES